MREMLVRNGRKIANVSKIGLLSNEFVRHLLNTSVFAQVTDRLVL